MSKFLVTGGLGFIGHHVVHQLRERNHDVAVVDSCVSYGAHGQKELELLRDERRNFVDRDRVYDVDICNAGGLDQVLEQERPKTIIHCASVPTQRLVAAMPAQAADVMITGLVNTLEAAKKHAVERIVFVSSSMVYGDFEDGQEEDSICEPQGQYGILKLAGEALVRDHAKRTGQEWIIVRPSAVYGARDVQDRVIGRWIAAARRDETLVVNGADQGLDFTYVTDCAAGIVSAATRIMSRNNIYNITRGQAVKLHEAAAMVIKVVGSGGIEIQDPDTNYPTRGSLAINRAKTILGYDPKIDLEQGIELYNTWLNSSDYGKWLFKPV